MCIICIELLSKKISTYEGRLALVELKSTMPPGHAEDVKQLIESLDWETERRLKKQWEGE